MGARVILSVTGMPGLGNKSRILRGKGRQPSRIWFLAAVALVSFVLGLDYAHGEIYLSQEFTAHVQTAPLIDLIPMCTAQDVLESSYTFFFPDSITTTTLDNITYALVASFDGVQVVQIHANGTLTPADAITDGAEFPKLGGAMGITATTLDNITYALVASHHDDGVQVVQIHANGTLTPADAITDGAEFPKLGGAMGITTTTLDNITYALVASFDGVQVVQIHANGMLTPADAITDGAEFPKLGGATGHHRHHAGQHHVRARRVTSTTTASRSSKYTPTARSRPLTP